MCRDVGIVHALYEPLLEQTLLRLFQLPIDVLLHDLLDGKDHLVGSLTGFLDFGDEVVFRLCQLVQHAGKGLKPHHAPSKCGQAFLQLLHVLTGVRTLQHAMCLADLAWCDEGQQHMRGRLSSQSKVDVKKAFGGRQSTHFIIYHAQKVRRPGNQLWPLPFQLEERCETGLRVRLRMKKYNGRKRRDTGQKKKTRHGEREREREVL